jgi:hypothetical protein
MNKRRRDILKRAVSALETAENFINSALDEEKDCLYNCPENLEGSEKYEKMETAIDKLEEAIENVDEAKNCIEEASE